MRIYTSCWFTPLPPDVFKVGISRGTPRRYPAGYRKLPELAPGLWFNSVTPEKYHMLYMSQLEHLDPPAIVAKLERMSGGRDVALLCYEAPHKLDDWCHRGQVSAWLWETLSMEVFEFGMEHLGGGWQHPKLHQCARKDGAPRINTA